jgi:hypothetical protein
MAENKGVLQKQDRGFRSRFSSRPGTATRNCNRAIEAQAAQWAKTQKNVETIRKRPPRAFSDPGREPIPSTAAGYQTAFPLGVSPSYKF